MKKNYKNILIITLCFIICLMAVAYMNFYTQLSINGKGVFAGTWSIKIANITTSAIIGNAGNQTEPTYTDDSATFYSFLDSPGDSIEYAIKITNFGTINASLKKINLDYEENSDIEFTSHGFNVGDIIKAGESRTLYVKVKFKEFGNGSNQIGNLIVNLLYQQADSVESSFSTVDGNVTYDGAPCANCTVALYNDCNIVYETVTDSLGNYSIMNISPGSYNLYAKNDYYSTRKVITLNSCSYNSDLSIEQGVSIPICAG